MQRMGLCPGWQRIKVWCQPCGTVHALHKGSFKQHAWQALQQQGIKAKK